MIILTELGPNGKPIEEHGVAKSWSTRLDTPENRSILETLMEKFSHNEPTKIFAIALQTHQILKRTGEPQHPCG
jgi:hypothetical protein